MVIWGGGGGIVTAHLLLNYTIPSHAGLTVTVLYYVGHSRYKFVFVYFYYPSKLPGLTNVKKYIC